MKVVLDTNVLLAAFATRGLCEAVLAVCLESHDIMLSEHILKELHSHLVGKFKLPRRQARETVEFLREQAQIVEPAAVPTKACRDGDDLPVLGAALTSGAECIVTGDKDLLTLRKYHGILILDPRAFYDRLSK
jgi:putative PIN family toxin of toxin-antitoxin system